MSLPVEIDDYSEDVSVVVSYSQLEALEVDVLVDGTWCFGTLHEWRQRDGRWIGWIRYNQAPGVNRIGSFDQDLIRPHTDVDPRTLRVQEAGEG